MSEPSPQIDKTSVAGWLLTAGLLVAGIGGAFLPWLYRAPVALQLTAPGLAEFVKFLPEVRSAQVQVERLYFLLPLFVAMLALSLAAENQALRLPRWWRWLLRLAVLPLALAALSPVWTPAVLTSAEFRLQTGLAIAAVGLAVIAPWLRRLPLTALAASLTLTALAAIWLPYSHFSRVQAGLNQAYHEPVSLGWGWWLAVAGLLLAVVSAVEAALAARSKR